MQPIKPKFAWFGLGVVGIAATVTLSLLPFSCAVRAPRIVHLPIGQHVTLMPVSVNDSRPVRATGINYSALRLNILWGGRPIRSGATLRLYKKGVAEPAWSQSWDDLVAAYKTTGCDNDQIGTMDGGEGTALICDGSLKIEDFYAADAIDDNGDVRRATSWSTFAVSDDVLAAAIQLF